MTYQISSLFFSPFLLAFVFAVVSLHDPFRGELGKNAVAKSTSEQCELLNVSQESLGNCPEHEIIAHRRRSITQRRLSTEVWEGRVPLVFPLFAMVILIIGFALMLFVCHQGTMACLSCTLEAFAGRTKEPCWSMLGFVGTVGRVSGLGALHFPNCRRGLQGHVLRPYSVPSRRPAEQLFRSFAWCRVGIYITRAGLRGRRGRHWTWWRVWRVFTKRFRSFTSTFSKGFIFFR